MAEYTRRQYSCFKCGERHAKPMGKKCKNIRDKNTEDSGVVTKDTLVDFMSEIKSLLNGATQKIGKIEGRLDKNEEDSLTEVRNDNVKHDLTGNEFREIEENSLLVNIVQNSPEERAGHVIVDEELIESGNQIQTSLAGMDRQLIAENSTANMHVSQSLDANARAKQLQDKLQEMDRQKKEIEQMMEEIRTGLKYTEKRSSTNVENVVQSQQDCDKNKETTELSGVIKEMRTILEEVRNNKGQQSVLANTGMEYSVLANTRAAENVLANIQEEIQYEATSQGKGAGQASDNFGQINNNALANVNYRAGEFMNNDSLKANVAVVQQAAKRLAELGLQEDTEETTGQGIVNSNMKGRKSGAISKATDKITIDTDWPHYHITRGINLAPSFYEEFSLEEFVLGYLRMLTEPDSKFNFEVMIEILKDLYEDSVDFSWLNAKAFYKSIAVEVEHEKIKFEDSLLLQKCHMINCRFHKQNPRGNTEKKSFKQMPQGGVCSALFQTGECDKKFDHGTYVHACAFCWKNKNVLFKHKETECFSKNREVPKH